MVLDTDNFLGLAGLMSSNSLTPVMNLNLHGYLSEQSAKYHELLVACCSSRNAKMGVSEQLRVIVPSGVRFVGDLRPSSAHKTAFVRLISPHDCNISVEFDIEGILNK